MAHETAALADALYERGALPAPLKREFVDNLVEQGECICGTALVPGSSAWQSVTGWRERAGLVEVELEAWQRLGGQVEQIDAARTQLRESLVGATKQLEDATGRVEVLEDQLSERNAELERIGRLATDVGALEEKRKDLDLRIAQVELEKAAQLKEIEENKSNVDSLRTAISGGSKGRDRDHRTSPSGHRQQGPNSARRDPGDWSSSASPS